MTGPDTAGRRSMSAVDAQMFWMSDKLPNDQFLLYAFAGSPSPLGDALATMCRNAEACDGLSMRVVDDCPLRYPRWVSIAPDVSQCEVHVSDLRWQDCLDDIGRLAARQLDARERAWRAHVYPNVGDIPAAPGRGSVVVMQIVHSLGDGTRSAALAGAVLGRPGRIVAVDADRGWLLPRAVTASRAHQQLVRDIEAGRVSPAVPPRPALSINRPRSAQSVLRTFRLDRASLSGPTVTVAAIASIGEALAGYLGSRGEDASQLGAEVPMRRAAKGNSHNNFRNVSVGLYPKLERSERVQRIAGEIAMLRRRGEHPASVASESAFASTPAALLRWGVRLFDPTRRSLTVAGNTVISSVNRGAADLSFGGCPVVLTSGYPALSPMQSLTHGIHGIGDSVAISVHADPSNIDVDEYLARLRNAFRC